MMDDNDLSWLIMLLIMILPEEKVMEAFERAKQKCGEIQGGNTNDGTGSTRTDQGSER